MKLFVYGTLMYAPLRLALCGTRLRHRPASLPDHRRRAVRGEAYPAIRPVPGGCVRGLVVSGIPTSRMGFLDAFEGNEYRRVVRRVHLDDGRSLHAWCYVWSPRLAARLDACDWDAQIFERQALTRYLRRCRMLGQGYRRRRDVAPATTRSA